MVSTDLNKRRASWNYSGRFLQWIFPAIVRTDRYKWQK